MGMIMIEYSKHILAIDDDPDVHRILKPLFSRIGFRYSVCFDEDEALDKIRKTKYDAVIVDGRLLNVPGIDICKRIAALEEARDVPIVYMTSYYRDHSFLRKLVDEYRVDLIIHKPLHPKDLIKRVSRITGANVENLMNDEDEKEIVKEFRREYLSSFFDKLNRMETYIKSIDINEPDRDLVLKLLSLVHRIHGTAGTYGFYNLGEIAGDFEEKINEVLLGLPAFSQDMVDALANLYEKVKVDFQLQYVQCVRAETKFDVTTINRAIFVDNTDELRERIISAAEKLDWIVSFSVNKTELQIVSDVQEFMPGVVFIAPGQQYGNSSGYAIATRLKEKFTSWNLAIIFMTDPDEVIDSVDVFRAGAVRYVSKVESPDRLFEIARDAVIAGRHDLGTVMIMDPDEAILEMARNLLNSEGYRVITLDEPYALWDKLIQERPDLLILNLNFPHFSGIDICHTLRADSRWRNLPVLFLTESAVREDLVDVYGAGADDYILKPIQIAPFLARIRNRLERVKLTQILAERDYLTGALNRQAFTDRFHAYMSRARRSGARVSVAMIDIDFFKSVNDTYGHSVGDTVLSTLGTVLISSFRREDLVCRWGGEEFVVAFPFTSQTESLIPLSRVHETFASMIFRDDQHTEFKVTFSAGVSMYPEDGDNLTALIKKADESLYIAKDAGRNRIVATMPPESDGTRSLSLMVKTGRELIDVLLVEDNIEISSQLTCMLNMRGHSHQVISDPASAKTYLFGERVIPPRVLLIDYMLMGGDIDRWMDKHVYPYISSNDIRIVVFNAPENLPAQSNLRYDVIDGPANIPYLMRIARLLLSQKVIH